MAIKYYNAPSKIRFIGSTAIDAFKLELVTIISEYVDKTNLNHLTLCQELGISLLDVNAIINKDVNCISLDTIFLVLEKINYDINVFTFNNKLFSVTINDHDAI